MLPQLLATQKIQLSINPLAVVLLLLLAGCPPSPGGGITIAQIDSSVPTLTLGAGQPGGQDVSVIAGGSGQNGKLTSKTGALNLLATAKDPESGVQAVEIWVNKKTTSCDVNGVCRTQQPGLLGKPTFESTSARKKPGETTAESSILAQSLDLSQEIPQMSVPPGNSLTVDLIIYAVAVNNLGGRTQTPEITATWREP
jgi:hypothetical protein